MNADPCRNSSPPDPGIRRAVEALWRAGVETFESCEGGSGHAYHEPTIRFEGARTEGLRVLAIATQQGLEVSELRRVWWIADNDPLEPFWELILVKREQS